MAALIRLGLGLSGRLVIQGYGLPTFTNSLVLADEAINSDSALESGLIEVFPTGSIHEAVASVRNDGVVVQGAASVLEDVAGQTGGEG